jgi:hypothetical protein
LHYPDFIPATDREFDSFFENYDQVAARKVSGNPPEWPHVPPERAGELHRHYLAWHEAYLKVQGPRSSADYLAKREAAAAGRRALRDFNNQYVLYAREVTDAGREEIGAHVRDRVRTKPAAPGLQCRGDLYYPGIHLVELRNIRTIAHGEERERPGWGVRIFWGIMGENTEGDRLRLSAPPRSGYDLPHSVFTGRRRYRFDFDGDSGKTVWFCLRYENKKGGPGSEGPFGPLFSSVIPSLLTGVQGAWAPQ